MGNKQVQFRITVITNMNTTNVGNQALSTELLRLVRRVHAGHQIACLGRSTGLERYSIEGLRRAGPAAVSIFEGWVEDIIRKYRFNRRTPQAFGSGSVDTVKLHELESLSLKLELVKLPLKKVRSALRRFKFFNRAYEKRLQQLEASDLVVYNPAGEISNPDMALRQLLELRVAQKLGCRIMVVNHSMEIIDPIVRDLISKLYSEFDGIIVREDLSRQILISMKVPEERVRVAPDAAFLATPAEDPVVEELLKREAIGAGTVAIAINSHATAEELLGWGEIVRELQRLGKPIIFVSNCLWADQRVGIELQRRYGVQVMSQQYRYPEYIGLLSRVELVISNRLHTCVFAMIGNTPVIPLEPGIVKVTGLFRLVDYPVAVVKAGASHWVDDTLQSINYVYENYGAVQNSLKTAVGYLREWAEENVRWDMVPAADAVGQS